MSRLNIYKTEFLISSHQTSLSFFSSVSLIISLLVLVFTPKDLESSLTLVFFSCSLSSPSFASTPVCPECDHFSSSPLLAQWSKHCHLLAELLRKKILTGLSASFFPSLQSVHQLASNVIILKYKSYFCHSSVHNLIMASHLIPNKIQKPYNGIQGLTLSCLGTSFTLSPIAAPTSVFYHADLLVPLTHQASPRFRAFVIAAPSAWKILPS